MLTYLADRPFDGFFDMTSFMQETWLLYEVAREKSLIYGLLHRESDLARVVFDKITASETAVTAFIRDRRLADQIIHDPGIREKLWEDDALREQLIENLGAFESLKEFEAFIAERVDGYMHLSR